MIADDAALPSLYTEQTTFYPSLVGSHFALSHLSSPPTPCRVFGFDGRDRLITPTSHHPNREAIISSGEVSETPAIDPMGGNQFFLASDKHSQLVAFHPRRLTGKIDASCFTFKSQYNVQIIIPILKISAEDNIFQIDASSSPRDFATCRASSASSGVTYVQSTKANSRSPSRYPPLRISASYCLI